MRPLPHGYTNETAGDARSACSAHAVSLNDSPLRVERNQVDEQDGGMPRLDPRVLVLLPALMILGACGGDRKPGPPVASSPVAVPSASVTVPEPEPSDSVYEEEEPEPQEPGPGTLSDEAQSYLDEALGIELGALETAPQGTADQKRKVLDRLPEDPAQVLAALDDYQWFSPEAKALYDRAAAAS